MALMRVVVELADPAPLRAVEGRVERVEACEASKIRRSLLGEPLPVVGVGGGEPPPVLVAAETSGGMKNKE